VSGGGFASMGGLRIVSGWIAVPLVGLWAADVTLASEASIPSPNVTLTVGNLSLTGFICRQAPFAGSRYCRVVGGFGGWRNTIPAKQYGLPGGIKLSLVLKDAAAECGEQINIPNDTTIGTRYVRENAKASRVLRQLAGENWYVDQNGVTQIAAWPMAPVKSLFTVQSHDGGQGRMVISTEDYGAWLPNASFQSPFIDLTYTIAGVLFKMQEDGVLRLEVLTQQ
jgi:hypothetical protein